MSMIRQTRVKSKPARVTARPATEFGQGILPARRQRFEPTPADQAWAAGLFGNLYGDWAGRLLTGLDRDLDHRALDSAALDSQPYGAFV